MTAAFQVQIFGRKQYAAPLTLLGPVTVENEADAKTAALAAFGACDWIELIALPEPHVIRVISDGVVKP